MNTHPLKTIILLAFYFLTINHSQAEQSNTAVSFDSSRWDFIGNTVVEDYLGQKSLKLEAKQEGQPFGFGSTILKDMIFINGIIEYDIVFDKTETFAGLKCPTQRNKNFENFYMRPKQSGNSDANQYMPVYNTIPSWQLYYGEAYKTPSEYIFNQWIHVKMVVASKLAEFISGTSSFQR